MTRVSVPAMDALLGHKFPVLDDGFDPPEYLLAIKDALANGHRVDPENGLIFGLKGKPLLIAIKGKQKYPTVPLVTPNMPRRFYAVPAHKVVAYAIWGDAAFAPGVHVRHVRGPTTNIRADNLTLGTASQNEMDKSPETRTRTAKTARATQGPVPHNRKFSDSEIYQIKEICQSGKRGTKAKLARQHGVSRSTITNIINGVYQYEPKP